MQITEAILRTKLRHYSIIIQAETVHFWTDAVWDCGATVACSKKKKKKKRHAGTTCAAAPPLPLRFVSWGNKRRTGQLHRIAIRARVTPREREVPLLADPHRGNIHARRQTGVRFHHTDTALASEPPYSSCGPLQLRTAVFTRGRG